MSKVVSTQVNEKLFPHLKNHQEASLKQQQWWTKVFITFPSDKMSNNIDTKAGGTRNTSLPQVSTISGILPLLEHKHATLQRNFVHPKVTTFQTRQHANLNNIQVKHGEWVKLIISLLIHKEERGKEQKTGEHRKQLARQWF